MTIVMVFCGYERWVIMENEFLLGFFLLGHGGARTICGYIYIYIYIFGFECWILFLLV